jgi:hypothetical protein
MKFLTGIGRQFSIAFLAALALSVMAIPGTAWSGLREDMREFQLFLRDRPRIAADLRANPDLVTSRRYLDRHEDLARFLRHRPAVRDEIRYNPRRALSGYYAYDRVDRYDRFGRWR